MMYFFCFLQLGYGPCSFSRIVFKKNYMFVFVRQYYHVSIFFGIAWLKRKTPNSCFLRKHHGASYCIGLNWIGLDWIELDGIGLNWIEEDLIELNWIELGWIGLNWIELDWIGLDWIELNWIELNSIQLD